MFPKKTNLLVGNAAECIVRILALQIDHELGELVIMSKSIGGVLCNQVSTNIGK
jgi:hypothetical protein